MTKEQLNKGIELDNHLCSMNQAKKYILKTLKKIEYSEYRIGNDIELYFDNERCLVNKDRIISFLNSELEFTNKKILELTLEFRDL